MSWVGLYWTLVVLFRLCLGIQVMVTSNLGVMGKALLGFACLGYIRFRCSRYGYNGYSCHGEGCMVCRCPGYGYIKVLSDMGVGYLDYLRFRYSSYGYRGFRCPGYGCFNFSKKLFLLKLLYLVILTKNKNNK